MISRQTNLHCLPRCRRGSARTGGFSLIELLVVISIIGLLATLTVGLIGVASRKNKESRLKADLNKYVTAIDNYKAAIGSYPPDNPGKPHQNQLFYELSGTVYEGIGNSGKFSIPSRQESIAASDVITVFGRNGFANSARNDKEIKVTEVFKPSQFKELNIPNIDAEILVVPVQGPKLSSYRGVSFQLEIKARDNSLINPWLYDSSSTNRNNVSGFDLWAEVKLGKKIVRFSNWEKEPVVIGQTP